MNNKQFGYISFFLNKNRKKIFFLWLFLFLSCLIYLYFYKTEAIESKIEGAEGTDGYRVSKILETEFKFNPELTAAIVVEGKEKDNSLELAIREKFSEIDKITKIEKSEVKNTTLYFLEYEKDLALSKSQNLIKNIRETLRDWENKTGKKSYVTGHAAFFYDMKTTGAKDTARNEKIALLLAFIILIFNYGGFLPAFLPILMGATTIIFLKTIITFFNFEVNPLSESIDTMVGLALAIDYSLFLVSRFKEEVKEKNAEKALAETLKSSGETIIFSALIMFFSVLILAIPDLSSSRVVVRSLLIVISLSFLNSLIFLPAFLLYGKDFLERPFFLTNLLKKVDTYPYWRKFAAHVVDRPRRYFIFSVLFLLILSLPVLKIKIWEPIQTLTPKNTESVKGYEKLEKDGWGGELIPVTVIVQAPLGETVFSKKSLDFIAELSSSLQKLPLVGSIQSITPSGSEFKTEDYHNFYGNLYNLGLIGSDSRISRMVNVSGKADYTIVNVFPKELMDIHGTYEIINFIRNYATKHQDLKIMVGGTVVRSNDFTKELYGYLPQMSFLIIGGIFIILFTYMKAFLLPIKAAIMNFLPIMSAFGILILIFQYGYFQNFLNTPNNGAVTTLVPVMLFCIIFGLSMDYEVLILSRITEFYQKTGDIRISVIEGLARSGSVITGAALILLGVFFPGIFSQSPLVKEICIGITAAILIDATIVRLLLVPSFMMLMGKWNWWNPFSGKKEK